MSFTVPIFWKPPDWEFPPGFPSLPVCWEWNEGEPLPDFVSFVKGNLDEAMYFKVCLESINPPKITITKRNIAEMDFSFGGCLGWFFRHIENPEEWVRKACEYIRQYQPKIDIDIDSDLKEEKICFVLPENWKVKNVLKNNSPIPWEKTDNKICFTVTHESPTLITIALLTPTEETLNTTVNTTAQIAFITMVMFMIMQLMTTSIQTVKEMT